MKKENISFFYISVLMILSQSALNKSIVFLVIPLILYLIFNQNISNSFWMKKVYYLWFICFIGFTVGLINIVGYDFYYFFRDLIYFLLPILYIILGIYICKNTSDFKVLLKIIIISSFLVTIYNLIELFRNPNIIIQLGLQTRKDFVFSNTTATLVFFILYHSRKLNIKMFKNSVELLIMSMSFFSILISFSRTFYLLFIFIFILNYANKYRVILKMYWSFMFFNMFVIFGGAFLKVDEYELEGTTFFSKITHSLNEMVIKKYDSTFEIMHNWRGYEGFLGFSKFYEGNFFEILFGQGFGAVVYTPNWIFDSLENGLGILPFFHNGFITILLKSGIVGLFFFFAFFLKIITYTHKVIKLSPNKYQNFTATILQFTAFAIIIRSTVIHGIFFSSPPFILLVLMGVVIKMTFQRNTS